MSISYRITRAELCLFAEMLSMRQTVFLPEEEWGDGWREQAMRGLEQKGYVSRHSEGVVLNRVMSGLVRIMLDTKDPKVIRGERDARVYVHPEMVLLYIKDKRSREHYKLIPYADWTRFLEEGYLIREESADG